MVVQIHKARHDDAAPGVDVTGTGVGFFQLPLRPCLPDKPVVVHHPPAPVQPGQSVFDHHASYGAIQGSLSEVSRAADRLGLRACLCYEVSDRDGEEKSLQSVQENKDFIDYCESHPSDTLKAMALVAARSRWRSMYHHWPSSTS